MSSNPNGSRGQTVGYVRVSAADQNPARQYEALGDLDRVFEDRLSGKNADRPELQRMVEYVRDGDTVRVASFDRLARNLDDLRSLVRSLTGKGVQVHFVKEGLTFTGEDSPMSLLLLSLLGSVAEFERSLIRERQADGIRAAKKRGVYTGRKPSLTAEQVTDARVRHQAGIPISKIARSVGVSRATVYAALAGTGTYAETEGAA